MYNPPLFGERGVLYFYLALLVGIGALLFPLDCLAWGPAAHLHMAVTVLEESRILPSAVQNLISTFPMQFMYGCIASDVIQAKGTVADPLYHCHNWRIGFELLKKASSRRLRAFSLGYLCHLAADIYAHNCFIPFKIVETFDKTFVKHVYWELKADTFFASSQVLRFMRMLRKADFDEENALLAGSLRRTIFSFKTSKRIFDGILFISRMDKWQKMMERFWGADLPLNEKVLNRLENYSINAMAAVLVDGDAAACTSVEPHGETRLATAKKIRRRLRRALSFKLRRKGIKSIASRTAAVFLNDPLSYENEGEFMADISDSMEGL